MKSALSWFNCGRFQATYHIHVQTCSCLQIQIYFFVLELEEREALLWGPHKWQATLCVRRGDRGWYERLDQSVEQGHQRGRDRLQCLHGEEQRYCMGSVMFIRGLTFGAFWGYSLHTNQPPQQIMKRSIHKNTSQSTYKKLKIHENLPPTIRSNWLLHTHTHIKLMQILNWTNI